MTTRRTALLLALLASALCQAQTNPVKVQKHWIGESAADFLQDEPSMSPRIAQCIALNEKVAEAAAPLPEKKHQSSYDKMMAATNQEIAVEDAKIPVISHGCGPLLAALRQNGTGFFDNIDSGDQQAVLNAETAPTSTRWFFENGRLMEIKIWFYKATYQQIRDDMTARVGVQPIEASTPEENGFGATWTDLRADWLTDSIHAHLEQQNNPADPQLSMVVESRAAFDAEIKKLKSQPSPLD